MSAPVEVVWATHNTPDDGVPYRVLRDEWNDEHTIRTIHAWVEDEDHEVHVYQEGGRWHWLCPCGASSSQGFRRRMDADEDVWVHIEALPHA